MFQSKQSLFFSGTLLVAFIAVFTLFPRTEKSLQQQKQPPLAVEVKAPLPMPVEVQAPVEVKDPVAVEASVPLPVAVQTPVAVKALAPLPVAVQESGHDVIEGQVYLASEANDALDSIPIRWARPDGTRFYEIPSDHILFVTDILVMGEPPAGTDDFFQVVFSDRAPDGSVSRQFDIGGSSTNLPYSHSFTTPKFVRFAEPDHELGIARITDQPLEVTLTGYLEPITQ